MKVFILGEWRISKIQNNATRQPLDIFTLNELEINIELPLVSFEEISTATNNFSSNNMIGRGGFGVVYKVRCHFTIVILLDFFQSHVHFKFKNYVLM